MPTSVGPNTKGEENLVFGYDLGDVSNSYKGEPTINYVPGTYDYSLYAYASGPVDTTVLNENSKSITAKRYTITNAVNIARAAIFPSGLTTGVAYTFSFKWKYNGTTTTSPGIGVDASKGNPEGGANNNGFTSTTSSTVAIGNGWYLTTYTFVFSSNPTGACMLTFGISTGSTSSYVGETFDIYEAQFEIKDHRTQYSNGTRSATQGLQDLTGNSTIDLTNVSFDSNAQMTFDGSNDIINLGSSLDSYNTPTIEAVFKSNSASGTDFKVIIGWGAPSSGNYSGVHLGAGTSAYPDESLTVWVNGQTLQMAVRKGHGYYHDDKYHHVVVTLAPGANKIYIDGVEETVAFSYGSVNTDSGGFSQTNNTTYIGRRSYSSAHFFNGPIPLLKIYNRALTATEVKANFNAIKGRFNI